MVEQDDATVLPAGVSPEAQDITFHLTSVRTRDGIQSQYGFTLPDGGQVTGLDSAKLAGNPDLQVPFAFSSLGNLYKEFPAGSGNVIPISSPQLSLPAGASMQSALAYKKAFLVFGDLLNSLGAPAVLNLSTGVLDPLSGKPFGASWLANTQYNLGEVVTPANPVGGNGHTYVCTQAGKSGALQPAFPVLEGGTIGDGGAIWTETTPLMVQAIPAPELRPEARATIPAAALSRRTRRVFGLHHRQSAGRIDHFGPHRLRQHVRERRDSRQQRELF